MYELLGPIDVPFLWNVLPPLLPLVPGNHFYWPVFLTSVVGAFLLYLYHRSEAGSLRSYLLPDRIYRHGDAARDLVFLLINRSLHLFTVVLWVLVPVLAVEAFGALGGHLGLRQLSWGPGWAIAYTALLFVVRDAAFYVAHRAAHDWTWLWQFHKVHHTTRALNPASAFRQHPIDEVWTVVVMSISTTLLSAAFGIFFEPSSIVAYTIIGGDLLGQVARFLNTVHLQHSHVWFRYGPLLDHLFISPAHHQIHHSRARRHWDTNIGQTLAIWDWAFGTLYVPVDEDQPISFGVSAAEDERYGSLRAMFFLPFSDFLHVIRGGRVRADGMPVFEEPVLGPSVPAASAVEPAPAGADLDA